MRPPLCMRRFMSSDPTVAADGSYPIQLLQSYPENDPKGPCDNGRGDLIYGHIPFDAAFAATHWLKRPLPRDAPKLSPLLLARASGIFPVILLRTPVGRVVSEGQGSSL